MIKRLFDVVLSIFLIVLFFPLMVLIAILIRIDSPGAVIFRQKRVGRNGKLFTLYKFRTMVEDAESMGPVITASEN